MCAAGGELNNGGSRVGFTNDFPEEYGLVWFNLINEVIG
jgi:hypothetical protein